MSIHVSNPTPLFLFRYWLWRVLRDALKRGGEERTKSVLQLQWKNSLTDSTGCLKCLYNVQHYVHTLRPELCNSPRWLNNYSATVRTAWSGNWGLKANFSPFHRVRTGSRTQYVPKKVLLGLKRPDGKANRSNLSSVEVKKAWNCSSIRLFVWGSYLQNLGTSVSFLRTFTALCPPVHPFNCNLK
jgi:hypothetical protein